MLVSINQPAYLPWLGYFHRIAISDQHIVLDHVQFEKNSFTNRNKVRTKEGWTWLTVPVNTKGKFGDLSIRQIETAQNQRWQEKHWATIRHNYAKTPYFATHALFFEHIYQQTWDTLFALSWEITRYLLQEFNITTPLLFSSKMDVVGQKDELVLNLCRTVGATSYLSGPLGKNYLHEPMFAKAGIQVLYHNYHHPTYPQLYAGFEAYMAALDLLFNCGPESCEVLMKDQEEISR